MNLIRLYRAMTCNARVRVALSSTAVLYSTVGAVAQSIALDRRPADVSPWESPMVWFSLVGLLLSFAGVLIGVGSLIQTVKGMREALDDERTAREAFERDARESFARKDVLAATLEAIQNELAALRAERQGR